MAKKKNEFVLGADPEIFLLHPNGNPKSAIDIIQGTKENPFKISEKGHSVQVDNVLLEFNVPPSSTAKKMYNDIEIVMDWFNNNIPKGDKILIGTSLEFPKSELNCEKALEFGCDPDYNSWTQDVNEPPSPDTNLRTAGGHVHISFKGCTMDMALNVIRACDMFLGVPGVLFDKDKKRRQMYGKAGAFRFKNYPDGSSGVEYRSLSNFWIKSEKMVNMIYEQIDKMFDYVNQNGRIEGNTDLSKDIINCINTSDEEMAEKLINDHNIIDLKKY